MSRAIRGVTLTELVLVVGLLAILSSVALPNYQRTVERSRWRAAGDTLQAIYAGEQVYFSHNDAYTDLSGGGWADIYMDDPNTNEVSYDVRVSGPGDTKFTATAKRLSGPHNNKTQTIDETRSMAGTWTQP
ncbi:MAG: hypothetical protein HY601_01770 [Candidatus Omnitrophica bacterium]|nr:hypothetical protein [Candidatus Omnitrophota bacterium]